jgi:hypothetical protein
VNPTVRLRPFAHERLILALMLVATFAVVQAPGAQDQSRLALTQSILEHGDVTVERFGVSVDRARHGRHLYSDKAPGLSLVALPAVAAIRAAERLSGRNRAFVLWESEARLHAVRVAVLAPFLVLLALLVGRTAEGLAPRTGAAAAVTLALGTMVGALSTALFAHVPEAALCFAAFVVLARSRGRRAAAAAGALAGAAVLMDYEAAVVVVALGLYVAARKDVRALVAYALGGVPAALLLGAYNTVAFGSPLDLSYEFKVGPNAEAQSHGFFGIGDPDLDHLATTLVGERGLLTVSPVLAAGVVGLALTWRRGLRSEVALALGVVVAFLLVQSSYFDPLGGFSPGPRFMTPAVPILVVGVAIVLAVRAWVVAALAVVSVGLSTWNTFTWFEDVTGTWAKTVWSLIGLPRAIGVALVALAVASALAVALAPLVERQGAEAHLDRSAAR